MGGQLPELLFPVEMKNYSGFKDAPCENSIFTLILIILMLMLFYLLLSCAR